MIIAVRNLLSSNYQRICQKFMNNCRKGFYVQLSNRYHVITNRLRAWCHYTIAIPGLQAES